MGEPVPGRELAGRPVFVRRASAEEERDLRGGSDAADGEDFGADGGPLCSIGIPRPLGPSAPSVNRWFLWACPQPSSICSQLIGGGENNTIGRCTHFVGG